MYKWVWISLESNLIQENCSLGTLFWCQHLKLTILHLTAIDCHSKFIIYQTWFICTALLTHHLPSKTKKDYYKVSTSNDVKK